MLIRYGTLLLIIGAVVLLPRDSFAYTLNRDLQDNISPAQIRFLNVIHTVKDKESLWKIARSFDVKFSLLAKLNQLENPDLIFPGDRLVIEIKDDFSVVVTAGAPYSQQDRELPETIQRQASMHVTNPSKDDIFAPEVPTAVAEAPTVLSREPRRGPVQVSKVFDTLFDFIQWLKGNFGSAQNFNSGATLDPPSSAPYLSSSGPFRGPLFFNGQKPITHANFYQPVIPDALAPPPKS